MESFFSRAELRPIVDTTDASVEQFAQAIAGRFNSADRPLLTSRLTPALDVTTPLQQRRARAIAENSPTPSSSSVMLPDSPMPQKNTAVHNRSAPPVASLSSAPPVSSFSTVTMQTLGGVLSTPGVLILDIRPYSAYECARLRNAISLSVPSTLLKRPAFTLQKISTMISSVVSRKRFSTWSSASRILVYDADSVVLNDSSNLLGLLRKFRIANFKGDLAWLQGGFQSVWREAKSLVDEEGISDEEEESEKAETTSFLRARDLPVAAFTSTSTNSSLMTPPSTLRGRPSSDNTSSTAHSPLATRGSGKPPDLSPASRLVAANPFYDNIRQNRELSHGMTERIPLKLSDKAVSRVEELPFPWLRNLASVAGQGISTDALAMQFYRIELGEQRRMQGIMTHHSMTGIVMEHEKKESNKSGAVFPFSITAGVEKGTKNRYTDIWPFEHARVKLKSKSSDDYINASHVQPLSTRRRYIATQGPLPSTYVDFWTTVWEQDVKVICMLTKQFENGSVKCGSYWSSGQYGPFQLNCVSAVGALEEDRWALGGGFFAATNTDGNATDDGGHNHTIRRVFELRHSEFPALPPRVITQMQYVGWPDMDVPENPRGFLRFMKEVDTLVEKVASEGRSDKETTHQVPTLLHCSAGVGRTGSYIAINAILDGIRREIRKQAELRMSTSESESSTSKDDSDVESPSPIDMMDVDAARDQSVVPPSETVSDAGLTAPSAKFNSSSTPKSSLRNIPLPQPHSGPTAKLHISSNNGGNDIHIPVVPSTASPKEVPTPKPQEEVVHHQPVPSSPVSLAPTSPRKATRFKHSGGYVPRDRRMPMKRVVAPDFTIADADSMFTGPSINPAFAMDVEAVQPADLWAANLSNIGGNSSSGEGSASASGGDHTSGSRSDSGASARNAFITPMAQALAKMSSADDVPGPSQRSEFDSFRPLGRSVARARAGSGSGSGSGEGAMVSSGASVKSGSSGSGSGGGYTSSSSSLGLNMFSGMLLGSNHNMTNSPSPIPVAIPAATSDIHDVEQSRSMAAALPNLLAPKPVHPLQQPKIIQASLSKRGMKNRLGFGPSRSSTQSSSSVPSTDFLSSISSASSPPGIDTPQSSIEISRQSPCSPKENHSSNEASSQRLNGYDFVEPRKLHEDHAPRLLSSLEEPIREILEDMREQRMSLCQTLRQYVFVHNAIIEGSLQIVDEERKRAGIPAEDVDFDPLKDMVELTAASGKRGASPTELPKEDKKGEVALAKRPSFRRGKSASSGDLSSSSSS